MARELRRPFPKHASIARANRPALALRKRGGDRVAPKKKAKKKVGLCALRQNSHAIPRRSSELPSDRHRKWKKLLKLPPKPAGRRRLD